MWQLALLAAGFLVLVGVVPAVIWGPVLLRNLQERRVRETGAPATAVVTRISETGRHFGIERVPELVIEFEVTAAGRPPWRASITRIPAEEEVRFFFPGRVFQVRYDPAAPERISVPP
ncbi:MAG TPA: DUF3592 domain-containing protein [Crenalkalicoccus sp.]|nr:DUF3592 domain-containing protein [Crenalkalicoccus sp.]